MRRRHINSRAGRRSQTTERARSSALRRARRLSADGMNCSPNSPRRRRRARTWSCPERDVPEAIIVAGKGQDFGLRCPAATSSEDGQVKSTFGFVAPRGSKHRLRRLEAVLRSRLPQAEEDAREGERVVAHDLARHHDRRTGRLHRGWWRRTGGGGASEDRTIERTDGDRVLFAPNVAASVGVSLPVGRSTRVLS